MRLFILLLISLFALACHQKQNNAVAAPTTEEEKFNQFLDSLRQAGSSELNTANEIRNYLAKRIDMGASRDSLDFNYYKIPWSELSAFHCIELFERDELAARCGLTSYILAKLYNHAGITSYIYNCGYKDTRLTHEFNLVELNSRLIVQDAFYDITITDRKDNPKDFIELLTEIKSGDFSDIKIVQDTALTETWFNSRTELDSLFEAYEQYRGLYEGVVKEITDEDSRVKIMIKRNYKVFTTLPLENMMPMLKEDNLPDNYLSIYLKPLNINKSDKRQENDSLRSLVQSIVLN